MKIKFELSKVTGGWNGDKMEYNLSAHINGKGYNLLSNFHTGPLGFSIYQITAMLNDVLNDQNSINSVYLTGHGRISVMYFLTPVQRTLIANYFQNNKPLKPEKWFETSQKGSMVFFKNQAEQ